MTKKILFFRGRNTAGIVNDATGAGLCEGRTPVIVCREGDALAEPGDLTTGEIVRALFDSDDIIVVCNGGTTRQQVPVVLRLGQFAPETGANIQFVEVDRDGVVTNLATTIWKD